MTPQTPKPKPCNGLNSAGTAAGWSGIGASVVQHGAPRGLSVGSNLKVYSNFFGNQYVRTVPVGRIAGVAGTGLAAAGVGIEAIQLYNGTLEGGVSRFSLDTAVAGFGVFGGPIGAAGAGLFFVIEPMVIDAAKNAPGGNGSLSNQNLHYTGKNGNERCY